jgi:hypothetical protein
MPNTSPLKRRLAMTQITKSAKGSKIDSVRFYAVEVLIDGTKINTIVENRPVLGQRPHLRRS